MPNGTHVEKFLSVNHNWNDWQRTAAIIILSLLDIFAVALNILVMFIISNSAKLREKTDCLLITNLAFSDFLVAITIIPFSIDTLIHKEIRFSQSTSFFIGFANFTFCIASIITLMVLVIDQTLTIKLSFWYDQYRTPRTAMIAAAYIWIHSVSCALPPMFGLSSYTCFIANTGPCTLYQWAGTNSSILFTILVTTSSWGIALVVSIICYIQIAIISVSQMRKSKKRDILFSMPSVRSNGSRVFAPDNSQLSTSAAAKTSVPSQVYARSTSVLPLTEEGNNGEAITSCNADSTPRPIRSISRHRHLSTEKHMQRLRYYSDILRPAVTLLVIISTYFLTWSPFCIMLLIDVASKRKDYPQLSLVFLWIGHSSSFLNPVIYFLRYKKFRIALWTNYRKFFQRFNHHNIHPKTQEAPAIVISASFPSDRHVSSS